MDTAEEHANTGDRAVEARDVALELRVFGSSESADVESAERPSSAADASVIRR